MGERCSRLDSILYFSKRPSSTSTMHLPQVAFSAQIDSISTPSSRAAARTDVPSSTCPRRPEGWRITVCFLVIIFPDHEQWTMDHVLHIVHCPWTIVRSYAEPLLLQTAPPAPREPLPQLLRGSLRARSNLHVCTARRNQMLKSILLPSHTRRSYPEFFVKAVSSHCAHCLRR